MILIPGFKVMVHFKYSQCILYCPTAFTLPPVYMLLSAELLMHVASMIAEPLVIIGG